jgi:hypothetical protein
MSPHLCRKVECSVRKISLCLGGLDDDTTQTIIEDDSALTESALTLSHKLQLCKDDLKAWIKRRETFCQW